MGGKEKKEEIRKYNNEQKKTPEKMGSKSDEGSEPMRETSVNQGGGRRKKKPQQTNYGEEGGQIKKNGKKMVLNC